MADNGTSIILECNGVIFGGWESVSFGHSLDNMSREFYLDINDDTGGFATEIKEESECILYAVEDLDNLNSIGNLSSKTELFSGIIMDTNAGINASGYSFNCSGSGKTIDLVECSAIVLSSTWRNSKISKIIKDICSPYGINVDTSGLTDDYKIKSFSINNGDTAFAPIERLCRFSGVIPMETADGNLKLATVANMTDKSSVPLVVGKNVLDITRRRSVRDRMSKYIGKSITSGDGKSWSEKNLQISAAAFDSEITRYRPLVFMAENREEKKNLQSRVNWEAQVRAGRSLEYFVSIKDIYKRDGDKIKGVWQVGELVDLIVDTWNTNIEMLITALNFDMSEQGRNVVLTLRNKNTYRPNPSDQVEL